MKLIVILLFITFQASAIATAQQIHLNYKNVGIVKVLRSIQKQTGYSYAMKSSDIKYAKPVTLTLTSSSIEQTLQILFKDQPFNYRVKGKMIMIQLKDPEPPTPAPPVTRKDGEVTGRVVDEDGKPLVGATVSLKERNQGAVTDGEGRFIILNAPANGTLIITMVGRESRQVSYKNGLIGSIVLLEVNAVLDEIHVIAYGEIQKKFSTSNQGGVNAEVIARQPVTNPLLALQGRVAGLFIEQQSGVSGGAFSVRIQGKNSIGNGNLPLYVIDGVPFTSEAFGVGVKSGSLGSPTVSYLNFINPADISSIEILKDADATAIYGSRAANGAVLITTKKGKAGQSKVDLNLQTGWSKPARRPKMMNTAEYLDVRREALKNANRTPGPADFDINGVWDTTRNTDWQKELAGETAQYQNLQASVSGGTERSQYLAGAGYQRETTVFPGDFANVNASVHFNINHSSQNDKFKLQLSGTYLNGKNELPNGDLTDAAIRLAPTAPALHNPDGTLNWMPNPSNPNVYTFDNPLANLLSTYTIKSNNLIGSANLSYQLLPGLSAKSSFGYNRLTTDELAASPITSIRPDKRIFQKRYARYSDKSVNSWIIEPQLTYNKSFSFGIIDALVGSTFQHTNNEELTLYGEGHASDALLPDFNAAPTKQVSNSTLSTYRYNALFGRLNYRLLNRYIVNLTARRDGSSRFGSENLFHNFYSVGGAWIFSEENIFKNIAPVLSFGKLRASYGTTGNDQIGDYSFYSLYDSYGAGIPYQNTVGLVPRGLSNPYLQWEETKKINLGVDLGFFADRILINANYFRNRSSNQLLSENLTAVTGFRNISKNLPAIVQNTGWEFTLDFTPIRGKSFNWSGSGNITIPQNKLIRYDGLPQNNTSLFVVGKSISIVRAYPFEGVNPETGFYQFRNEKGEIVKTPSSATDKTVLIDTAPEWYGGFSNTFSFKGFTLDIFFQYVKQRSRNFRFAQYPGLNTNVNMLGAVADRWRKPGDEALYQKASANFFEVFGSIINAQNSDAAYTDASYLRLKNASLSYVLTPNMLRKVHISSARIFVQGQNLFTVSNYFGGGDPEIRSLTTLGVLRTITVGTQLSF